MNAKRTCVSPAASAMAATAGAGCSSTSGARLIERMSSPPSEPAPVSTPSESADGAGAADRPPATPGPCTGAGGCSGRVVGPDAPPNDSALDMGDSKRARCTEEEPPALESACGRQQTMGNAVVGTGRDGMWRKGKGRCLVGDDHCLREIAELADVRIDVLCKQSQSTSKWAYALDAKLHSMLPAGVRKPTISPAPKPTVQSAPGFMIWTSSAKRSASSAIGRRARRRGSSSAGTGSEAARRLCAVLNSVRFCAGESDGGAGASMQPSSNH